MGPGGKARLHVKRVRTVESGRMTLRRGIAFALLGDGMDHHGPVHSSGFLDHPYQSRNVVPVHRPQVCNAHVLKEHTRNHQLFEAALYPADPRHHIVAPGDTPQSLIDPPFQIQIAVGCTDIVQIFGDTSHILGDGHIVVVEDDNEIGLQLPRIVQRLICHPPRHGPVADDGHHGLVQPLDIPGLHQAQARRDGSGAVPRVKSVAVALLALGKTAHAPKLPQTVKSVLTPGEDFVCVGLMPHIPDNFVLREPQGKMECHGQFHSPQIGAQMPSRHADLTDQEIPDFLGQFFIGPGIYIFDIVYISDLL